ncbi:MAG: aminotransferase class I/II-fold pyridoxal phosphate-dependent enzyme [bacterium]|nr:aminotransferase class I/II-fold pyridoxal phosphate-dependent enzyme [bacterium]
MNVRIKKTDLFDKSDNYVFSKFLEEMGLSPFFQPISMNSGPIVEMEGKEVIMIGSNNYLGLSIDPRIKEAAINAIEKYGTGCSGSRFLNGTYDIHLELEKKLAQFTGKEAALLFSTGFQTNQGCIVPLISENDYIISDEENHASIIQGAMIVKGRMGKDKTLVYKHNDMADLERVLESLPEDSGKLVVFDGVFSMSGDIVDLPGLVQVTKKYNARLLLDDAHGLGVLGECGRGTANHFGLDDDVDIIMGTFSKSCASQGGYIAASKDVIEYTKYNSPAFMYSASMPPSQVASALKAIEIMESEPNRMERLFAIQHKIRTGLRGLGFNVLDGQVPIIPLMIGEDEKTFLFWKSLMEQGVFVNPVIYPAVPKDSGLLRLSFMSTLEDHHLNTILEKFEKVGREMGMI